MWSKINKLTKSRAYLLIIPLIVSIGVASTFYPGFMSYDTTHALSAARNGVTDSIWPPMVSYVWRFVDLFSLNPSAMHFSQVYLLIFSVFLIIFIFTKKISYAVTFLFLYLSIPVVLGTIAVIWKDVLMAAFFIASFLIILVIRDVKNRWIFFTLFLLVVFLIFLGVCSRHNAITAAVPLFFYLSWVVCSRVFKSNLKLLLGVILLGSVLTGAIYASKIQLDRYSLPNFEKLDSSKDLFLESVRVLDVAGASLCVGRNLFADMAPNLTLSEIRSRYDPKHINLSTSLFDKVSLDSRINKIWLNVALNHPICFFSNKYQMTKYMVGANGSSQFIITHPSIDANEYGYKLEKSLFRDSVVSYIIDASKLPYFKPWFIYIISVISFIYLVFVGRLTLEYLSIYSSGVFYFSGLFLFGNAADARLLFYTTSTILIFIFVSVFEFIKRRQK